MEQSKIFEILKKLNIPVTYKEWPIGEAPALPYVVFTKRGYDTFLADNKVFEAESMYDIELCSEGKDEDLEQSLISILDEEAIIWDWTGEARTPEGIYIVSMNI